MSDHEKILADLSAYLDGELSHAQAQRVEEAARQEPAVARELAALRRTRELVRGLERVKTSPDFVAGVLEKAERLRLVRAEERPSGGSFFRWMAAAAVLLVAVGVGVTVAVMFLSTPHVDRTGPIAIVKTDTPKPDGKTTAREPGRMAGLPPRVLEEAKATSAEDVTGLSGDGVIYARDADFDQAVKDVAGALRANDVTSPRYARQDREGRKEVTILAYAAPSQAKQLSVSLEAVRERYGQDEADAFLRTSDRERTAPAPAAAPSPVIADVATPGGAAGAGGHGPVPAPSVRQLAPAEESPALARRVTSPLRSLGAKADGPARTEQTVPGLGGDAKLPSSRALESNLSGGILSVQDVYSQNTVTRSPAGNDLSNSLNVQLVLITVRSKSDRAEGGAEAVAAAGARSTPAPASGPAASSPASREANSK